MPKYHIHVQVEKASGTQCWEVEADSEEEALKKYNSGDGDIVAEEIEVTELGTPTIDDVELADDE